MTLQPTAQTPERSSRTSTLVWGVILLVGGVVLLLQSLSVLEDSPWVWSAVFGLTGVALLVVFATRREAWWAAIPAGVALGLGASSLVEQVGPSGPEGESVSGAAFLGLMGLGFAAVWARDRRSWWAVIPAGVLLSLSGTVLAEQWWGENASVSVLFLGLAATFVALSLLRMEGRRRAWPLWPAAALGLAGVLFAVGEGDALEALDVIFPAAAIAVGAWLLWRFVGHDRLRPR